MPIQFLGQPRPPSRVGTTRALTIPTSPITLVLSLSASVGMSFFNIGPSTLAWGGSGSLTQGSGGLLFYSMQKEWMGLADTMAVYVVADSVAGVLSVQDYF